MERAAAYLACGATDMRKSIDGLAALVTNSLNLDLFSNSLFRYRDGVDPSGLLGLPDNWPHEPIDSKVYRRCLLLVR